MMSKQSEMKLQSWMQDYSECHQTPGNRMTHVLGIPMIIVAVGGLLNGVVFFDTGIFVQGSLGLVVLAALMTFYISLDQRVGLVTALVMSFFYVLGCLLTVPQAAILFFAGWGLQFLGHLLYEKKSPAFFKNALHLLVGPAYLTKRYLIRG